MLYLQRFFNVSIEYVIKRIGTDVIDLNEVLTYFDDVPSLGKHINTILNTTESLLQTSKVIDVEAHID
jgi:hypothetical protein